MTIAPPRQQFVFASQRMPRVDAGAAERLVRARKVAGYTTAGAAIAYRGWDMANYLAHEAGQRGMTTVEAQRYATGYRVSVRWLLMGE